ncbi:MAG: flagellin [Chromatiales bacterium]|nr:flagellin [Chromatiales bacterium]
MAQVINTNILSLTAQRNLNNSQGALATSLERLSSGLRINSAKDDAAGLAIAERFTTQIRGLNQAIRNANDGISFAQTGEGALSTIGGNLQRIRELAVQSINDTNSSSDRQALNNEVSQLIADVNRVANSTQFNGQNVLDGSLSNLTFQVGANQNQTIQVDGVDARGSQLGARISTSGSFTSTAIAAATNDFSLNGITIDLSSATTTNDVVNAVNAVQADTGVQALKATSVDTGELAVTTTGVVSINSVQVNVDSLDITATVDAINAVTNQTGVTARAEGAGIALSNNDGSDIVIDNTGTGQLGGVATSETYQAGVVLAGAVADGAFTAANGGLTDVAGTLFGAATQTDNTLNQVDVLTGTNANDALLTLDFALQQVTGLRAELGAVQIRFESTIANLSVASENLSAARSRIQDADFAAETAELTRAQIVQQAGISVLSQANAQPQNVLALLQ